MRIDAYEELKNWRDSEYQKENFIKDLPELAKEKHCKVLGVLIEAIETVLDESVFDSLDIASFYENFLDCMMSNVKGDS